jgi:hypothetical protein
MMKGPIQRVLLLAATVLLVEMPPQIYADAASGSPVTSSNSAPGPGAAPRDQGFRAHTLDDEDEEEPALPLRVVLRGSGDAPLSLFSLGPSTVAARIHADRLHAGDPLHGVVQIAPQVYALRLFTPRYARQLVAACDANDGWDDHPDVFDAEHGFVVPDEPASSNAGGGARTDGNGTAVSPTPGYGRYVATGGEENFPDFAQLYYAIARRHLLPVIEKLWPSFRVRRIDDPRVLRYEFPVLRGMGLHHDAETVSLIGYLNAGFRGGGTLFPRYNTSSAVSGLGPGSIVLYPGSVSHQHLALNIKSGKRYVLLGAYY